MKKLMWTCIAVLICFGCLGQRYEVWAKTTLQYNTFKGNYGFSNDSVLVIYTNPSWFIPSKDFHFAWDDVSNFKLRNHSRMSTGMLIGTAFGGLVGYVHITSLKNSKKDPGPGGYITMLFMLPLYAIVGPLAGKLATSKKTEFHVHGMSSKDKNQLLKSNMKRKGQYKGQ